MSNKSRKVERLRAALSHREADRVPAGEFYWSGFLQSCKQKWGEDFDPYRFFDLDYVVINPNMDPRILPFQVLREEGEEIVVKTGFGATIRRSGTAPMPAFESFSVQSAEAMADFPMDDPADLRRFFQGGDDQINGVGDTLVRDIPAWSDRLLNYADDFALFGSICEPYEYLWRIIGSENALYWMATERDRIEDFVERLGKYLCRMAEAEIEAGRGQLAGMYIWGDVAYRKGMLFGKTRWREIFKPHVGALIDLCHSKGLLVIYHGCGNAIDIFDDMVELKLDAYNPVEAKTGLNIVELKKKYKGKLAFVGNLDVRILEAGSPEAIQREVLYKLEAARGGGWIFQSDHSISSAVAPESYELALKILREFGEYPLELPKMSISC